MTHYQLRLDLIHGIHRDTDDNQQGSTAKVERDAQAVGKPCRKALEEISQHAGQVVQVDAADHPLRNDRDNAEIDASHQREPGKDAIHIFLRALAGTNAGNKPTISPHIVGHPGRIKDDRDVEISEKDDADNVQKLVQRLAATQLIENPRKSTGVLEVLPQK